MIVGITGSIGGGKGTVVDFLKDKKHFTHYSSSDHLISILESRNEAVDRDGMNRVANELRANNSAGVPAETYKKYLAEGEGRDVILESLHSVPEVDFIKSIGGVVIGVTADPNIRFDRISKRGSVKDNVSKEKFIAQQEREEKGSNNSNESNIFDTLRQADYIIENNGTLEDLYTQIEEILKKIG